VPALFVFELKLNGEAFAFPAISLRKELVLETTKRKMILIRSVNTDNRYCRTHSLASAENTVHKCKL
jgi:hypothetical protein